MRGVLGLCARNRHSALSGSFEKPCSRFLSGLLREYSICCSNYPRSLILGPKQIRSRTLKGNTVEAENLTPEGNDI